MFRTRRDLTGRRFLITGCSSGIGRALALQLGRRQTNLLITARREDRLDSLAHEIRSLGSQAVCVAGDVTDPTVQQGLCDAAQRHFNGLDVLVNNAGIGAIGDFSSADAGRLRRVMEVNLFAAADLIRRSLPLLQASGQGVIVNIGSVLGHFAVPKKSEYCASKFALHGFTDALRLELATKGVDVLLVSPSTTDSEFFDRAMRADGEAAVNRYSMPPDVVAGHIVRAIEARRRELILSAGGKLLVWADRLLPGWTSRLLQRYG